MVKAFQIIQPHKIIFGNGKITELPSLATMFGNDILLVAGGSSFISSKSCEFLLNTFDLTGIRYHLDSISREPSPEMIDHIVIRHRNDRIKLVIAIGGGSVLDAGKAISAMLYKQESVAEYIEGIGNGNHPGTKIPFIAVPTTSGTGSEATKNAVISQVGKNGFKRSLRHDNFIPDIAILDPELTLSCSQALTAACGMDCFTQLVESYLSEKSFTYTDALALEGILLLKNSLIRAWKWGQDLEARAGMAYASMLSGICLANAGLGVVHGFASSIGSFHHIPHGIVCATLMGVTNRVTVLNLRKQPVLHPVLIKYATLGKLFYDGQQQSDTYYIESFLAKIEEYIELLGIPRLQSLGIHREDIPQIVDHTDCKTHPVQLSGEELTEILESRL